MHRRGSQADAPASDAAGRRDAGGTPQTSRPCRVVPRRATWQVPNRADAAEIRAKAAEIGANAAQIGSTRSVSAETAESGRNSKKKKKKKVQTHRLTNLNTQTPLRPSHRVTLHPKLPKILSHSVPHLPSLCAPSLISLLCVSSSLWVLCAHCTASAFRCAFSALFLNFYSLFFTISLFQIA